MCKSASEPLLDCEVYWHIGNGFIRCHVEQRTYVPCKGEGKPICGTTQHLFNFQVSTFCSFVKYTPP